MANESTEIGSIVKKCKILLLDIEGTTTSISFVKDKLFPYVEENVKQFLESKWEEKNVKEAVEALRKLALEDKEKSVEGVVIIPGEDATKEEQVEGLVRNVKWQMSSDRKAGPLKLLQGLIWKQGYDKGEIKGHVYEDVSPALEQWHSREGQKVYIYSSGSVEAQKLLFGQSMAGDLLSYIDGHFDTAVGAKQEAASYAAIVEKIGCKSEEILFLTDIVKEAEAARASGLYVALMSREGNAPLSEVARAAYPVLHSLAELTLTNKRKPDPQEEQPAKVAKTDVENDVKATTETNIEEATGTTTEELKTETMEVDEPATDETPVAEVKKVSDDDSQDMKVLDTEIKEITDPAELVDIPPIDIKPVIIEDSADKTEEKETEKMDTESPSENSTEIENKQEKSDSDKVSQTEKVTENKLVPEENVADVVITEIEDVSDKQTLSEVAEIIEDLEPVVEEPPVVEDMEELKNVGEVLEKECDEILSKVQDVTNLDNIPLKPLLNPIAEETMETDNVDSNDIVDRILDTELEMEMKQCNDIDLNTVQEITETKPNNDSESQTQEEKTTPPTTNDVLEEKPVEQPVETKEETSTVAEKVKESPQSITTETVAPENKPEELVEKVVEKQAEVENNETPELQTTSQITSESSESVPVPNEANKNEMVKEETKTENCEEAKEQKEPHVNGKATNGDSETVNLNGDASKNEELNSRLSVENGKEVVNGSNGDSRDGEKLQTDSAPETDIKVKTVAVEEPRTDPIEQPTEA